MRVAIMQPTYMPWIGYFALMQQVDHFVLLDDVQFSKQSWQQRNRVKSKSGPIWLSVPVLSKGKSKQLISEVRISSDTTWSDKHFSAIEACYGGSPYWKENEPWLSEFYANPPNELLTLNRTAILLIRQQLGIDTPIVLSSELNAASGRVDRLVDICQHLGADEYISPIGSFDYLRDSNEFRDAGIQLRFQNFRHPQYEQINGDFTPFMSVIDLLCNALPLAYETTVAGSSRPLSCEEVKL